MPRYLALVLLLLFPTWAGAQLTIPYDVPDPSGGQETLCPNGNWPGCPTGLEENDVALLGGIVALDGDDDGVADTAAALETDPTTCDFAGAGEFVVDFAADGTLVCQVPAGSGDMVQATWDSQFDTDNNNIVDSTEGVVCAGCIGDSDISTITLAIVAADDFVQDVTASTGSGLVISGTSPDRTIGLAACADEEMMRRVGTTNWSCQKDWVEYGFYVSNIATYQAASNGDQCYKLASNVTYDLLTCYDASGGTETINILEKNAGARGSDAGTALCGTDVTTSDDGATCTITDTTGLVNEWICLDATGSLPTGADVIGCTLRANRTD